MRFKHNEKTSPSPNMTARESFSKRHCNDVHC